MHTAAKITPLPCVKICHELPVLVRPRGANAKVPYARPGIAPRCFCPCRGGRLSSPLRICRATQDQRLPLQGVDAVGAHVQFSSKCCSPGVEQFNRGQFGFGSAQVHQVVAERSTADLKFGADSTNRGNPRRINRCDLTIAARGILPTHDSAELVIGMVAPLEDSSLAVQPESAFALRAIQGRFNWRSSGNIFVNSASDNGLFWRVGTPRIVAGVAPLYIYRNLHRRSSFRRECGVTTVWAPTTRSSRSLVDRQANRPSKRRETCNGEFGLKSDLDAHNMAARTRHTALERRHIRPTTAKKEDAGSPIA